MIPQPWPVILPLLVFVAAPPAAEAWGLPDLRQDDKQAHTLAGAVVGTLATAAAQRLLARAPWWEQLVVGVAASAIAGAAKEATDRVADPKDFIATAAGGAAGALAITLIWRF